MRQKKQELKKCKLKTLTMRLKYRQFDYVRKHKMYFTREFKFKYILSIYIDIYNISMMARGFRRSHIYLLKLRYLRKLIVYCQIYFILFYITYFNVLNKYGIKYSMDKKNLQY